MVYSYIMPWPQYTKIRERRSTKKGNFTKYPFNLINLISQKLSQCRDAFGGNVVAAWDPSLAESIKEWKGETLGAKCKLYLK